MGTIFHVFGRVCYTYAMLFILTCLNSVCECGCVGLRFGGAHGRGAVQKDGHMCYLIFNLKYGFILYKIA